MQELDTEKEAGIVSAQTLVALSPEVRSKSKVGLQHDY